MNNLFAITGPQIHTEEGGLPQGNVVIANGKIEAINSRLAGIDPILTFPANWHIIPGMIDLHIHGLQGADVMDNKKESILRIARALPQYGVTGFLATTMTASIDRLKRVLTTIHGCLTKNSPSIGAELLGIHLEGPFINAKMCGAQNSNDILPPDAQLFQQLQQSAGNLIKIVTLAPEEDKDYSLINCLKSHGVIASIGHSNATYEQTMLAIQKGCSQATHLFNAMHPIYHRDPGCAVAILNSDQVLAEIIMDGIHIHPGMIQLALRSKGFENILLITDGLAVTGLSDEKHLLDGQEVMIKNHGAYLPNGHLAGSILTMDQALRNFLSFTNSSLKDAIQITAVNPAKHLGLYHQIGSIRETKNADLVVLNEKLEVMMTICQGQITFTHKDVKAI